MQSRGSSMQYLGGRPAFGGGFAAAYLCLLILATPFFALDTGVCLPPSFPSLLAPALSPEWCELADCVRHLSFQDYDGGCQAQLRGTPDRSNFITKNMLLNLKAKLFKKRHPNYPTLPDQRSL